MEKLMTSRDLEYLSEDDLPKRLDATTAESNHVLTTGILRPMNTPGHGTLPSYLTADLQEARRAIFFARLDGFPLGHDEPARANGQTSEPKTIPIEAEEMPEAEDDVNGMMEEVYG